MSSNVTHAKEPLFRMVKRDAIPQKKAWMIRAAAFLLSLATGAVVIMMLGHNPFSVYISMIKGAWGTKTVSYETIKIAIPLLITAIGISFAFKMKFWNIGAEGQILVGAVAAGAFGLFTAHIFPKIPLVILMMLAAIVAGGLYGLLPAVCKAKWGTNETLFTLMLNYIALAFIKYLMNGPWKAPGSSYPKIAMLVPGARLTKVFGVHWGWILALILVVVSYIYFNKTKQGYEIAVVGESNNTARYAGINVGRVFRRTMFLSGALCGLVGMLQFAGSDFTITEGTAGGVGFTAITVAWLAKMNPAGMLVVSVFIAMLERGANAIQTQFALFADFEEVAGRLKDSGIQTKRQTELQQEMLEVSNQLSGYQNKREQLYNDYVDSILSAGDYIALKTHFDTAYQEQSSRLNQLSVELARLNRMLSDENKWLVNIRNIRKARKLTPEIAQAMIDHINVYKTGYAQHRLEIIFRFQEERDVLEAVYHEMEGGEPQ